ncbi:MAG: ATP-binding protein [Patescibacteria group bacterium]|nr:ATP-binding protein [Patescibacteria group bacterium]
MSPYTLTCFITGIVAGVTGLFVFLKERKQQLNQIWCFLNFAIAIWMLGLGGTLVVNDQNIALFSQRILYIGTILIPVLFFQFCVVLIGKQREKNFITLFKINTLLVIVFVFSLFVGDLFIKYVKPRTPFGYWPIEVGWLYYPFLLWFFLNVIYAFILLRKNIKKEKDIIKRKQTDIIFYGALIGFIAGSANFLLDFNIVFPPLHNLFVISYLFFTALAITRYHLFGIKVILTENLVGIMGILLLIFSFLLPGNYRIFGLGVFLLFCLFAYFLLKATYEESKRREEAEKISIRERALRKRAEKLARLKSEFLAMSSHQLRTPPTSIKGYLSLILEGRYGEIPNQIKEVLKKVSQANERLIRIANQFLRASNLELGGLKPELKEVALEKEILEPLIEEFKPKIEAKNLYFKLEKPEEPTKVFVDLDQVKEIFSNLLDNALKYTPKGGIEISVKKEEKSVLVAVKDTGEGLSQEEKLIIFESFGKGKAGYLHWMEGAGLGLYIARKLVELNKGKIWAESEGKGRGSTFFVALPLV